MLSSRSPRPIRQPVPHFGDRAKEVREITARSIGILLGVADNSKRRTCIFCGSDARLTREHLWPQWLSRHTGPEGDLASSWKNGLSYGIQDVSGIKVMPFEIKNRPAPAADTVLKVVCNSCNSGWMAQLEARSQPVLVNQMADRHHRVSESERDTLVHWLMKTTAVFEFDDRKSVYLSAVTNRSVAAFDTDRLGRWDVRAAWSSDDTFGIAHGLLQTSSGDGPIAMHQTIKCGHALYLVRHSEIPQFNFPALPRGIRSVQLWPNLEDSTRPHVGKRNVNHLLYGTVYS